MVMHEEDAVFTSERQWSSVSICGDLAAPRNCTLTANQFQNMPMLGITQLRSIWAAVQLHGKQCRMEISPAPPECEKKLTNGNSPQQYVSAMRHIYCPVKQRRRQGAGWPAKGRNSTKVPSKKAISPKASQEAGKNIKSTKAPMSTKPDSKSTEIDAAEVAKSAKPQVQAVPG